MLLMILMKVTKITTGHLKWAKQNYKLFFARKKKQKKPWPKTKKPSTGARSRPCSAHCPIAV